jgi:hypothetical protein
MYDAHVANSHFETWNPSTISANGGKIMQYHKKKRTRAAMPQQSSSGGGVDDPGKLKEKRIA